jgi:hypothetical protein
VVSTQQRRRSSHGSEGAFSGSKWNLYIEWRLLHRRDLTERGSALLDAIARELLGYRKSRGEIGRRRLMDWVGMTDGRDFNRVREELAALGLVVTHEGRGVGTRTTYDVGPLLAQALLARADRRPDSRRCRSEIDGSPAVLIDGSLATETTAPEPPRIETSSSKDAYGVPMDSFGVERDESVNDMSSLPPEGFATETNPIATKALEGANGAAPYNPLAPLVANWATDEATT